MCPGVPRDLRPSANCLPVVWISSTKPTARVPVCLFVSVFPFDKGYIRLADRPSWLQSVYCPDCKSTVSLRLLSLMNWLRMFPLASLACIWRERCTLGNVKCKMSSEVIESHHHLSLNYLYGRPRPTQEMWHKIVEIIVKLMWNYCQN